MHIARIIACIWLLGASVVGELSAAGGNLWAGANIYGYGKNLASDYPLGRALQQYGIIYKELSDEELISFTFPKGSLLLVDGGHPVPPKSRPALYQLRQNGGQLVVFGTGAFRYGPLPDKAIPIVNLSDSSQYRIERPVRRIKAASFEEPVIETIITDKGTTGLSVRTEHRGMPDIMIHLTPGAAAANRRSVLTLSARGNVFTDLLSVEVTDRSAKKWLGFIPIGKEWQDYCLSFADLIPEGWNVAMGEYPLLRPEEIMDIALGTNLLTVWREQPMEFAISDVALAEDTSGYYVPTAHNLPLRLPFYENRTQVPSWLLDERGYQYREFPGSVTGTDTRKAYDRAAERVVRLVKPLPDAVLQLAGDGMFRGSTFGIFNQSLTVIQADPDLTASVARTIYEMVSRPRITAVVPDVIRSRNGDYRFALHVTVHNAGRKSVTGQLEIEVGASLFATQNDITVSPFSSRTFLIEAPPIESTFPFAHFRWNVRFCTETYTDSLTDTVDVERALLHSFIHLHNVQEMYGDGRFSHHYFGDAYGARAQLAYASYLGRHPGSRRVNTDLWKLINETDIEHGALRFFDMLVNKQDADGGLPMGYSEHTGGRNVADGGQMALSVAQSLRYVTDSARANTFRILCKHFFEWAEMFYIDESKAVELAVSHPESAAKGDANAGHYGLGRSRNTINPTGPLWVLSDILGFQLLWAKLTADPEAVHIANRNKSFYLHACPSAHGYYQAEALCWAWMDSQQDSIRASISALLRNTFLPALLEGGPRDMYLLGGRTTLKALPLLYYRRMIEDSAALRAVCLKYVWSYASENAPDAIRQLRYRFPKPVHGESLMAVKYASLSALWAMELLQPGCTLHPVLAGRNREIIQAD